MITVPMTVTAPEPVPMAVAADPTVEMQIQPVTMEAWTGGEY